MAQEGMLDLQRRASLNSKSSTPLLSVNNLGIYYGEGPRSVQAVDNVSFNVAEEQAIAFVGESGSGKTTVALAISNLLPAAARIIEGTITFKGKGLLGMTPDELRHVRGKEIGMVFQEPASYLNPCIKVGEQVSEAFRIHYCLRKDEAASKAKAILERVRVPDVERVYHYYPHQLSGGMAQRVGIAIALSCQPSLLLADEPTSNLDLTVQAQILHLLKTFNRELGLAILLISHDLGVVSGMADRVVIMYAGRIAEEADVHSIFRNPRHPYTQALLVASRIAQQKEGGEVKGSLPDLTNPPPGCRFSPRCPKATEQCQKEPPEVTFEGGARVYCWLYGRSE
jgi:oligopeptide/dipeptide ABC transporter ATP-binding protein